MEFRVLGPLEASEAGERIPVGGTKQRALLAVLLLNANRVVPRDRLIDALWEEEPPETARKAVRVAGRSVCQALHACQTGTLIAQTRYWCGFAGPEALTEESATSGRSPGDSRVNLGAGLETACRLLRGRRRSVSGLRNSEHRRPTPETHVPAR